jgi:membrane protease YdiL (CAAX protease family)
MPPEALPSRLLVLVSELLLVAIAASWVWALGRLRAGRPLLPKTPPAPVPWGIGSILAVVVVWLLLNVGFANLIHAFVQLGEKPPVQPPNAPRGENVVETMLVVACVNVAMLWAVPRWLQLTSGARLADLGLSRPRPFDNVVVGVVACLLLLPLIYAVQLAALRVWPMKKEHVHPVAQMLHDQPTAPVIALAVVSAVVLAPAAEELAFRGILLGWLLRRWNSSKELIKPPREPLADLDLDLADGPARHEAEAGNQPEDLLTWSPTAPPTRSTQHAARSIAAEHAALSIRKFAPMMPNLVTSVFFAALHWGQWPAPLAIFVLSLGLGVLYQRTGSLLAPIALHATFNGISTLFLLLSMLGGGPVPPTPVP